MPAVIGRIIRAPSNIARFLLLHLNIALELQWTIKSGATPISGVKVWISTDDPFTAQNLVGTIQDCNGSGVVTYTLSQDVTYYGWRDHPTYTFADPWVFRYSSSNARWETYDGTNWVEWTP